MTVNPAYFSPTNPFLIQATGQVIGYIRQPGRFKLLEYVQAVKSKSTDQAGKPICAYAIIDPDAPIRTGPSAGATVTNPDLQGTYGPSVDAQWRWAPGDDAPPGNIAPHFRWQTLEMIRRAYPYTFDEQTDESADLPVGQIHRQMAASLAMTVKTHRVIKMLEAAGNWPASNVADANTLNGGKGSWANASAEEASPNFLAIRRAVQQAAVNVVLATNSTVQPEDLKMIISANAAMRLGSTGEVYNYVKYGTFSEERQAGKNQLNDRYGMPQFYAGVEWIVEDASIVTDYPVSPQAGGTPSTNRLYIKNDTTAVMVSRKGGLDGVYGAPSFSTVQLYYYKYEMAVEEIHDTWNKLHKGRLVEQYAEVLAANRAGYLITNIL